MKPADDVHDWWVKVLLGESETAHPVFGGDIDVHVEGKVVRLTGEVETAEQLEELEKEAKSVARGRPVVNRLRVLGTNDIEHLQTILALFTDEQHARLAGQTLGSWALRSDDPAEVISDPLEAEARLRDLGNAAAVPAGELNGFTEAVRAGKPLLVARVPEDDAFRVISGLEETPAETVQSLPPEPDSVE